MNALNFIHKRFSKQIHSSPKIANKIAMSPNPKIRTSKKFKNCHVWPEMATSDNPVHAYVWKNIIVLESQINWGRSVYNHTLS